MAGWAYQWMNQLSLARDSWTVPLDLRRVQPGKDANSVAAAQIKEMARRLPADGRVPLCVFAAGYDPVQLAFDLRKKRCVCFHADPDPTNAAVTGCPRRHGRTFACANPAMWPPPTTEHTTEDEQYGRVRVPVVAWSGLHAIPQNHATTGTHGPKPIVRGTLVLVLVEVEQLPRQTRTPQQRWL